MHYKDFLATIERLKSTADAMKAIVNSAPNHVPEGDGRSMIQALIQRGGGILRELESGEIETALNEKY